MITTCPANDKARKRHLFAGRWRTSVRLARAKDERGDKARFADASYHAEKFPVGRTALAERAHTSLIEGRAAPRPQVGQQRPDGPGARLGDLRTRQPPVIAHFQPLRRM